MPVALSNNRKSGEYMKRNSSLAKIILAAVFFHTNIALAADNFAQQTVSDARAADPLQPLVCQKVPSPYWNSENGGERPLVDDPACVAENNRRASARANIGGVQAQAERVSTNSNTTLVAPKAPAYTCGSMETFSSEFQACQNSYNAANKQYQKDLSVYNQAATASGDVQKADELKAIEDQKNKTATATLAEIKEKNDKGKKSYDKTAMITMALGVAALIKGTSCASSCPTGCCAAAPAFFATAAAMFLLNSKAKKQSGEHAASAQNACESLNQLSSQPSSCGSNSSGSNGSTTTVSYDPITGKCLPEGSEECKQLPGITAAPPNVKDALKTSGFASGKLPADAFTVSDGQVKFKNGKTYKDSDFKDINSLMAAGLGAGAAKGVMDSLGQASGGIADLGLDAKLKDKSKDGSGSGGSFSGPDGATTVVDVNRGQNSDKKYSDDLGAGKKDDKKFDQDRAPSSEGLAKEFNGELIGVAGDDIFLMMNRRYKLKSEQDSFIAQDLK